MVGGGGKKRWWWWEENDCQTNIVCLFGMFKFTCEIITCMISHDDLGLVPWKSTRRSTEFNFFFTDSGQTRYRITRHNNKKTIPIIFQDQSGRTPGLQPDSGRNTRGRVKTSSRT